MKPGDVSREESVRPEARREMLRLQNNKKRRGWASYGKVGEGVGEETVDAVGLRFPALSPDALSDFSRGDPEVGLRNREVGGSLGLDLCVVVDFLLLIFGCWFD